MGFFETDVENIVDAIKDGAWRPNETSEDKILESLQEYLHRKFTGEVFEMKSGTPGLTTLFKEGAKVTILLQTDVSSYEAYYKVVGEMYDLLIKRKSEILVIFYKSNKDPYKKLLQEAIVFFDNLRDFGVESKKTKFIDV